MGVAATQFAFCKPTNGVTPSGGGVTPRELVLCHDSSSKVMLAPLFSARLAGTEEKDGNGWYTRLYTEMDEIEKQFKRNIVAPRQSSSMELQAVQLANLKQSLCLLETLAIENPTTLNETETHMLTYTCAYATLVNNPAVFKDFTDKLRTTAKAIYYDKTEIPKIGHTFCSVDGNSTSACTPDQRLEGGYFFSIFAAMPIPQA